MKKILLAGVTVVTLSTMFAVTAEARDGCGAHRFRADNGRCYWMRHQQDNYYNPPGISFGIFGGGPYGGGGWHHGWHH